MKRCFSTLCCLNDTPEQVVAYAVKNNMDAVEVRVNEKGEAFGKCTVTDAERIRDLFLENGIGISDLALSCSIKGFDPVQIETGKKGIDFAAALNSGAVRIFAGEHREYLSEKTENDLDGIKKAVSVLSDYGKEKNVDILLETHSSFSSGKKMKELIDFIQRDNVNVIWDVIHSLEFHESPRETAEYLGSRIVHVHLKDGIPSDDADRVQFVHTDLGKGIVSVPDVLNALKKIGYDGCYSLEWESPWRSEIQDLYPDINDLLKSYNDFLDKF